MILSLDGALKVTMIAWLERLGRGMKNVGILPSFSWGGGGGWFGGDDGFTGEVTGIVDDIRRPHTWTSGLFCRELRFWIW